MAISINNVLIKCPSCECTDLDVTHIDTVVQVRTKRERQKHYCVCKECKQHFGHFVVINNRGNGELDWEIYTKFLPALPHSWDVFVED